MKKLIPLLVLLSTGCTSAYIELAHQSSVLSGAPPSLIPEEETDFHMVHIGARRDTDSGLYIDGSLGWQVGDQELEGRDPFLRAAIGWKFYEKK